ncbi:MAG TPA: CsbD family protein [Dongiaceae bacterium]|nr:CsbD family protein [Dongiaceae bacterium]
MNKDQAAGSWKELKGKLKQQWGKLTDDDLTVLEGASDELSGRIQKRYGIAKEEAQEQIDAFRKTNQDLVSNW